MFVDDYSGSQLGTLLEITRAVNLGKLPLVLFPASKRMLGKGC
jgi:hypothetical protein